MRSCSAHVVRRVLSRRGSDELREGGLCWEARVWGAAIGVLPGERAGYVFCGVVGVEFRGTYRS